VYQRTPVSRKANVFGSLSGTASNGSSGDRKTFSWRPPPPPIALTASARHLPSKPARLFSKISLICFAIIERPIDCLVDAPKPPSWSVVVRLT